MLPFLRTSARVARTQRKAHCPMRVDLLARAERKGGDLSLRLNITSTHDPSFPSSVYRAMHSNRQDTNAGGEMNGGTAAGDVEGSHPHSHHDGSAAGRGLDANQLENEEVKRILRAMARVDVYTERQERARKFWNKRRKNYSSSYVEQNTSFVSMWSIRAQWKSMVDRRLPLSLSLRHAIYSAAFTVPFVYLHESNVGARPHFVTDLTTSLNSNFPILIWDYSQSATNYLVENNQLMTGCASFLATALFLMLSFRINRAISRWWEARSLFAELQGELRALAQSSQVYCNNNAVATDVGMLLYAYSRASEMRLRNHNDEIWRPQLSQILDNLATQSGLTEQIMQKATPNRLNFLIDQVSILLREAFDTGNVKGIRALVAMQENLGRIILTTEGLLRIQGTPEPWSYQKHLRLTTLIWLNILPLALLPSLQLFTPVLSSLIAFVVFKLDDVAVEVQSPFGFDRSDVSLCLYNDDLQNQMRALLLTYATLESRDTTSRLRSYPRVPQLVVDKEVDSNGLSHSK